MFCDPGLCTARACKNYDLKGSFKITQDDYHTSSTNFPILTISGTPGAAGDNVVFIDINNVAGYIINKRLQIYFSEENPGNFAVYLFSANNPTVQFGIVITEDSSPNLIVKFYKHDRYLITLPTVASGQPVSICLTRTVSFPVNNNILPAITLQACTGVEVPQINIDGQTLIDGSDVGDMIFTIKDKYSYYGKVVDRPCQSVECIDQHQVKTTIFEQCCPKMVSAIKGDLPTLQEKLEQLWLKYNLLPELYFRDFYENIILYGMAKYILSRLLYGYFDINFLLWQYNSQFLKDLGNSRFCNFVQFFQQAQFANYQNYFIF